MAGSAFSQNQNPFKFQVMESESIKKSVIGINYLFDWNLIMVWNQNQFHLLVLKSESISFVALESESNYPVGETVLGPESRRNPTHETETLFLYNSIKSETHS